MPDTTFACVNEECIAYQQGFLMEMEMDDDDKVVTPCPSCGEAMRLVLPDIVPSQED